MTAPDGSSERRVNGYLVRIDRDLCVGFGDCLSAAPGAFELDAEAVAVFRDPDIVEPSTLLNACAACPVDAISVHDADGDQVVP